MNILILGMGYILDFLQNALFFKLIADTYHQHKRKQILIMAAVCAGIFVLLNLKGVKMPHILLTTFVLCVCGWLIVKEESFAIISITFFYMVYLRCYEYIIILTFTLPRFWGNIFTEPMQMTGGAHAIFLLSIRGPEIIGLFLLQVWMRRINIVKSRMLKMFFASLAGYIAFEGIMFPSIVFKNDTSIIKLLIALLVIMTVVFILLMFDLDMSGKKYRIENERMKRQLLEEKYQSLNEIYSKNAKLYHDLNNHLNLLWQLLNEGKTEEAKTYISNISEPVRHMQKVTWTGVDLVDVVLNSKIEVMQEKNIAYQVNVELPQNTGISEADICTILSNLLDNAIEAVEKIPRQETPVRVTMRSIRKMLFIQISNPCIGIEIPEGGLPETSKKERERHGWGLWNVSDLAEKYQGTFQVECEKGVFQATVMLFFEEGKN